MHENCLLLVHEMGSRGCSRRIVINRWIRKAQHIHEKSSHSCTNQETNDSHENIFLYIIDITLTIVVQPHADNPPFLFLFSSVALLLVKMKVVVLAQDSLHDECFWQCGLLIYFWRFSDDRNLDKSFKQYRINFIFY